MLLRCDSSTVDRRDPDLRRFYPSWNASTSKYSTTTPGNERPLMIPGQEWRTRRDAR